MATKPILLGVRAWVPAAVNGAIIQPDVGTNFSPIGLLYTKAAVCTAFMFFKALQYGSGNLTFDAEWFALTATSGDVLFGASVAAITPNVDTTDILTKAFATENTQLDTHLGTTGKRLHTIPIVITNLDSIAANDWVVIKLRRLSTDGTDTMTGDLKVVGATLSYSDT